MAIKPEDSRPGKGSWAPGSYLCKCLACDCSFTGDKRALICADCAYAEDDTAMKMNGSILDALRAALAAFANAPRVEIVDEETRAVFCRKSDLYSARALLSCPNLEGEPSARAALQAIANLPTGANESIMQGHEEAYRAVEALFSVAPFVEVEQ